MTVNAVDANWNLITNVTHTIGITSSDVNAVLPGNAALSSGSGSFTVTMKTVGSRTATATDITDGTKAANTSASITISAGALVKLQLIAPGETAAPGTTTGKTGTPTAQAAGTAFNVTVSGVDANWNVVNTVTDLVGVNSSDSNATLPGNATLSFGTRVLSVTLRTTGSATLTASDVSNPSIQQFTTPSIQVNGGLFAKLQLLLPGETAAPGTATGKTGSPLAQTAGMAFTVIVNAVDANWNLLSTNDTVAISSSDANAALPANAALVSGTRTFSVTAKTAGSRTVTASDTTHAGITANTSPSFTVNPGAFTKLQLLVPGETASPGSATGKIGTPSAQSAFTFFNFTVNAVDANWNVVSAIADEMGVTASDSTATLPSSAALVNGTQSYQMAFNTNGALPSRQLI
jgi:hypothetical protein